MSSKITNDHKKNIDESEQKLIHHTASKMAEVGNFVETGRGKHMHLGKLCKEAIQKARLSYTEVAEHLGVGKQSVAYTVNQGDVYAKRLAEISQITGQNLVKELEKEFDLEDKKIRRSLPADNNGSENEIARLRREKQELLEHLKLTSRNFDHLQRIYEETE